MSDLVPDGWKVRPLAETTDVINGRAYKLTEWEDTGTPVIRLQNLTQKGGNFYYSKLKLPERQYCLNGDLLFMWSATFGPHIWWGDKAIYHYHIWKMVPDQKKLNKQYLYFYLLQKTQEWKANTSGMAMQHLTKSGIEAQEVILPPLPEQKKIASILTSVDDAIENTQRQIDKLQDLKKATMNELLTKGIGHTEFKDSELGRIPKSWEVKLLGEMVDPQRPITYGIVQAGKHIESGIPYIRVSDMKNDLLHPKDMLRTSEEIASKFQRSRVREGDIVYALRGDVGKVLRVPKSLEGANLTQGTALISASEAVNADFLIWCLASEIVQKQTNNLAKGSTFVEMSLGNLKNVILNIPSKEEQILITSILNAIGNKIASTKLKLTQLKSLKKSLMQDLLTGKVRVKVD